MRQANQILRKTSEYFALVKGHVFDEGNKRTAYIVAIVFLEQNGVICAPEQADIVETKLGAADGPVSENDLARWFEASGSTVELYILLILNMIGKTLQAVMRKEKTI